jgi:hypothetical protein
MTMMMTTTTMMMVMMMMIPIMQAITYIGGYLQNAFEQTRMIII